MSKRMGDVRVTDYIVGLFLNSKEILLNYFQAKGWEPEAVLNWLALVGWGNRSGDTSGKGQHGKSVPDVFTLEELEKQVWIFQTYQILSHLV